MDKQDQDFEVSSNGVLHLPTKARYVPGLTGQDGASWEEGTLGTPLGADFEAADVKKTMVRLWRNYLTRSVP